MGVVRGAMIYHDLWSVATCQVLYIPYHLHPRSLAARP